MAVAAVDKETQVGQKVYQAVPGSRITNSDAALAGPILEALALANNTTIPQLKTETICEVAHPEDHPLHAMIFKEGVEDAAYQHYLSNARHLIRSIRVEIVFTTREGPTTFVLPGMVSIRPTKTKERAYVPIQTAIETPKYFEQIKADAEQQAKHWYVRFSQYRSLDAFQTLEPLFQAIESLTASVPQRNTNSHDD